MEQILAGWAVIAIVATVLAKLPTWWERMRQRQIRKWAAHHGWTVTEQPVVDWTTQLPGRHQYGVSLLVSGLCGNRQVNVGEYSFTSRGSLAANMAMQASANNQGARDSYVTHHLLVTAVLLDAPYPALSVQPAFSRLDRAMLGEKVATLVTIAGTFGDNIAAPLGDNNVVATTGDDAFDRQFRIHTREPDAVKTVIGPELIAEHLTGRIPAWNVADNTLVTWQSGSIKDPRSIPKLAAPLLRVANLLGH